jgi:cytochrome c oxidase subunit IV
MINKNENENLAKLADKIAPKITTIEGTLSFTTFIGLALKISGIPQGAILILLSLSTISLVYFLSAYQSHEAETPAMTRFLHKLLFWSASICVIGILFRLQSFAGYNTMLIVGCMSLSLGLIFNFFSKVDLDRKFLIRTIIILAVGLSLYLTPSEKLKELKIINSIEKVTTK